MALFALLAALALAHAPSFREVWTGESAWSLGIDRCEPSFALRRDPGAIRAATEASCATVDAWRSGWDGWRRFREAWAARKSTVHFLVRDVWGATTTPDALNVLDRMVLMWPARLLFGASGGLAALHLSLLALGGLSGLVLARGLRCSPLAGAAAGVVIGGSGIVTEATLRGEYPQAILVGHCLFFAGLARATRHTQARPRPATDARASGRAESVAKDVHRFAWPFIATGLTFAALVDWGNTIVLAVGGAAFLLVSFDRRAVRPVAFGAIVAAILCLPAGLQAFEVLGDPWRVGWGVALPSHPSSAELGILQGEVPWFTLLDPRLGWLPALPLVPLALVGARARLGWSAVTAIGLLLAVGPWPIAPWGDRIFEGYSALPRTDNPVYALVFQWSPLAHDPMMWASLSTVALAAATALGVDRVRERWPNIVIGCVFGGMAWTISVGPWPMPQSPYPQDVVEALGDCKGLVLPAEPADAQAIDDVHRLEALLWVPRAPIAGEPATKEMVQWAELRDRGFRDAIDDAPLHGPDPLAGMCVLYESRWVGRDTQNTRETLVATFGQPTRVLVPSALFAVDGTTRRIEVYAGGRKPTP